MTILSTRAKEAIKTGLAMAIAYGIALRMNWENPDWAGFAVAMISLYTAGQSFNHGTLRMAGTLVGAVVALTLLGLFFQERWWLITVLSLYVGFCVYLMTGKQYQYFWQVSAFVCMIICVSAGTTSGEAFQTAVERTQETAMGILVYTLVSILLWPRGSAAELNEVARKLFATFVQEFPAYRGLMVGQNTEADFRPLRLQAIQLFGQLGPALEAAKTDTYAVFEVRHQWRRFRDQSLALLESLARWRESAPEVKHLDLARLLPNLDDLCAELEQRLIQIERMLAGEPPERRPRTMSLMIDKPGLRPCSHFEKAAVAVTKTELDRLESLTRSLFECVQDIKGYGEQRVGAYPEQAPRRGFIIDPDRFGAVIMVVANLWLAFLIWVYIDPPGHAGFVQLAPTIALGLARTPQARATAYFLPFAAGCIFAGVAYIFIMPKLSGYWELSLLIFGATFLIYYLFWEPRQGMAKFGGIIPFVVLISVHNEQSYSFAQYANGVAMILLAIGLVVITSYIPHSPRPEKAFLRLLARFFRHSRFLVSQMGANRGKKPGLVACWNTGYYRDDLLGLSQKLTLWAKAIDCRAFPENTPGQVEALVKSLDRLAFRLKILVDARDYPQAEFLVQRLSDDIRAWRVLIQDLFLRWVTDPTARPSGELQEKLAAQMTGIETRIQDTLSLAEQGALSDEDYENFYRLLGCYRGLSEAMVAHASAAEQINWARWREARF